MKKLPEICRFCRKRTRCEIDLKKEELNCQFDDIEKRKIKYELTMMNLPYYSKTPHTNLVFCALNKLDPIFDLEKEKDKFPLIVKTGDGMI